MLKTDLKIWLDFARSVSIKYRQALKITFQELLNHPNRSIEEINNERL